MTELQKVQGGEAGRRMLMVLTLVGLVLRVGLALGRPFYFPDSADYDALGVAISQGQAYVLPGGEDASRMPGYPIFVGLIYLLSGPSMGAAVLVQAILSAAVVPLTYVLGRRLDERGGLVAAGLVAVDPLTVAFSAALLSESLYTVVLLLALWAAVRIWDGAGGRHWVMLGVMWAVGIYLRASALYLILPVVIFLVAKGRAGIRRRCGWGLMTVGIVGVLLVPWQVRNIERFETWGMMLTSLEGISLYEAVYPDADGGPRQHLLEAPSSMKGMNEMERSRAWGKLAWGHVMEEPGRIVKLGLVKMGRTWAPWMNAGELRVWWVQAGSVAWHVPLFVMAMVGLWSLRGQRVMWLYVMPVIYFTLVHALYLGSVRYRVPLMPVVCVWAGVGVAKVIWRGDARTAGG